MIKATIMLAINTYRDDLLRECFTDQLTIRGRCRRDKREPYIELQNPSTSAWARLFWSCSELALLSLKGPKNKNVCYLLRLLNLLYR